MGVRIAVLADAVSAVQSFVGIFVAVYTLLIFAYILTSWVRVPHSLAPVQRFLYDVCEPYLRLFRRLLPSMGPLDLSPIVAVIVLYAIARVVDALLGLAH
jgi:uncharacterized protein YggT (Ycf19 family)